MATNFPSDLDDGTSLPTVSSGGVIASAETNTERDAIKEIEKLLVGPTFHSADAHAVTTGTQINNCESLTGGTPVSGTWFINNASGTLGLVTGNEGTFAVRAQNLYASIANNAALTSNCGVNLASGQDTGTWSHISIQMKYLLYSNLQGPAGDLFEFVLSDDVTFGGNAVTWAFPDVEDWTEDTWRTLYIPLQGLATLRCIGVRSKALEPKERDLRVQFIFDDIRWASQTELEVALEQAAAAVAIVPPGHTPAGSQKVLPALPASKGIIDLRDGKQVFSDLGGIKWARQFQLYPEDGSADVTDALQDIFHRLSPGDELHFTPGAVYKVDGPIRISVSDITVEGHGCKFLRETLTTAVRVFEVDYAERITFRNFSVIGEHDETWTGDDLVVESGAAIVGATMVLDAQNDSAIQSALPPYARDVDGNITVDVTVSDSAQVEDDFLIEFYDSAAPAAPTALSEVGAEGAIPAGTYYYRVSFVDAEGHESGMSQPASVTTVNTWSRIQMTLPLATNGATANGAPWMSRRVYRASASAGTFYPDDCNFYALVTEIDDNTTETWRDNMAIAPSAVPGPIQTAAVEGAAGNVEAGQHAWFVSTIDTTGKEHTWVSGTDYGISTVLTLSQNAQVTITLSGTNVSGVAKRRIYRTKAGIGRTQTYRMCYLVAEVNDNTTATYNDNTADASLSMIDHPAWDQEIDRVGPDTLLGQRRLTLTGTSTEYTCSFSPRTGGLDMELGIRYKKLTATANTITITQTVTHGRANYSTGVEGSHGFNITNCSDILIQNVRVEGVGGDFSHIADDSRRIYHRDCVSRAVRRQAFSAVAGSHAIYDRCLIAEPARSGIDIEPAGDNFVGTVDVINCEFRNVGNVPIAAHWTSGITIQNCRIRGQQGFGTNAGTQGGGDRLVIQGLSMPWFNLNCYGRDIYIDNVICRDIVVGSFSGGEKRLDRGTFSDRGVVRNVHMTVGDDIDGITLTNVITQNITGTNASTGNPEVIV